MRTVYAARNLKLDRFGRRAKDKPQTWTRFAESQTGEEGKSLSLRDNRSASVKSRLGGFLAFSCCPTHSTLRSRWLLSAGTPDGGTGTTSAAGQQPASEYLGKLLQPVASAAAYGYFEQFPQDMVLVSTALRLDCRPTRGRQARFRRREAQVCLLSACSSFPTCPTQTKTVPLQRPSQSISSCSSTARWSRPTTGAPPSTPISSTCFPFVLPVWPSTVLTERFPSSPSSPSSGARLQQRLCRHGHTAPTRFLEYTIRSRGCPSASLTA